MASIAERHKYILDTLQKDGFLKVTDVAKHLKVTTATIRNDLKCLEEFVVCKEWILLSPIRALPTLWLR